MKREVVRDFLNLPGIEGIALINERSRPFFLGIDQNLNFKQKQTLSQGIQQIIERIPDNFEFFEFQFSNHRVYIYKIESNMILMVLATDELVYANYSPVIALLKQEIQNDVSNAIANLRLAAGNVSLNEQSCFRRNNHNATESNIHTSSQHQSLEPLHNTLGSPNSAPLPPSHFRLRTYSNQNFNLYSSRH